MHPSEGPTRLTRHPHLTNSHPPGSLTLTTLSLSLSLSLLTPGSPHQALPRFSNLSSRFTYKVQATVPHRPLSPKGQHRRALPYPAIRILSTPPFLVWCSVRLACTAPQPAHQSTSDGTAFCAYHRLLHKTGASPCDFAPCSPQAVCSTPSSATRPRPRLHHLVVRTWPRRKVTEFRDRGSCQEHNHEVATRANKNRPKPRVVEPGKKPQ